MDKQIKKLAHRLRDDGVAPERDLWPDIEARLDSAPRSAPGRTPFRADTWWRLAAVAATLTLLVGAGYFSGSPSNVGPVAPVAMVDEPVVETSTETEAGPSLLNRLNNTISELEAAMALDPDNLKLTRLSLMAHKSRGQLLRVGTRR